MKSPKTIFKFKVYLGLAGHCNLCPNFHKNKPFTDIFIYKSLQVYLCISYSTFPRAKTQLFFIYIYIQTTKLLPVLDFRPLLKFKCNTNQYNDIHPILICNTFIYNFYIQRYTCIYTQFN